MERNIDNWWTRLGILAVVLLLYGACWFGIPLLIELDQDGSWSTRGQFGDMFGTVNALFSGLAFAGIIYTILLQREELKEQRAELQLTREELKGQKQEFKTQNITLKRQRFEATFFNMVSIHYKIMDLTLYKSQSGVRAFVQISKDFDRIFQDAASKRQNQIVSNERISNVFLAGYSELSKTLQLYFSPYIQSIVQLHRTIKKNNFKPDVELRYFETLKL